MLENYVWDDLENMRRRMHRVLDQLQQVHAKLASTAVTADRVFVQITAERSALDLVNTE